MQLIDTHCHLNIIVKDTFDTPLPDNFKVLGQVVLEASAANGVSTLINVGTSAIESKNCIALARAFGQCYAAIGTHPNDVQENWQEDIEQYKNLLQDPRNKIVAIGEIGLDYHYPQYNKNLQYNALHAQIELALAHNLPIIIHTRNASTEVLDILESHKQRKPRGVFHCFSEDYAFAQRAVNLGFMLGIGGTLTYPKNHELRKVFKQVPLQSIVLETDAPFLPPQVLRGKQNSPAYLHMTAHYLAELREIDVKQVAQITTQTAQKLFGIKE